MQADTHPLQSLYSCLFHARNVHYGQSKIPTESLKRRFFLAGTEIKFSFGKAARLIVESGSAVPGMP